MNRPRIPLALLLALGLSACFKVGPDYRKPEVPIPHAWRFSPAEARDAANFHWWEQFGDPVLVQLIEEAVRSNKDVAIATAAVEEYLGLYGVTRSSLLPQISDEADGGRQKLSGYSIGGREITYSTIQSALNLSWEIDVWGRLRRATEAARADLLGREENRRAVILTLVAGVARSYVQLRELDQRLEIARHTLADRGEAYRIAQARFRGGLNSEAQVRQAESEVHNAESLVPQLEKQVAQQEHALSVLLGHNPAAVKRGMALAELRLPQVPAGLPSDLLTRRPDLRQAEQALIAAGARIGVARGNYFPKFTLTGTLGSASADFSHLLAGPAGIWSYALGLTMPLFSAGQIAGQVRAAQAQERQALLGYQNTLLQAFRETEDALVENAKTREQVRALAKQVDSLREYLRLARLRYDNGYTNYLEVLDAQRNLLNVQLSLVQSRSNGLQAMITLYKAFGGGWVDAALPPAEMEPAAIVP